jgi:hypothetical protein
MSDTSLTRMTTQQTMHQTRTDCSALMQLATMGAIIGGSAAAAKNLRRVELGDLPATTAVTETGKAAIGAAVATAIAGAAASALTEQGLLRLGIMFAAGTLTLYALQRRSDKEPAGDE